MKLSTQVYAPEHRGKGITIEPVKLLVRYLFEARRVNRIRLIIHPDNRASRRHTEDDIYLGRVGRQMGMLREHLRTLPRKFFLMKILYRVIFFLAVRQ